MKYYIALWRNRIRGHVVDTTKPSVPTWSRVTSRAEDVFLYRVTAGLAAVSVVLVSAVTPWVTIPAALLLCVPAGFLIGLIPGAVAYRHGVPVTTQWGKELAWAYQKARTLMTRSQQRRAVRSIQELDTAHLTLTDALAEVEQAAAAAHAQSWSEPLLLEELQAQIAALRSAVDVNAAKGRVLAEQFHGLATDRKAAQAEAAQVAQALKAASSLGVARRALAAASSARVPALRRD